MNSSDKYVKQHSKEIETYKNEFFATFCCAISEGDKRNTMAASAHTSWPNKQ